MSGVKGRSGGIPKPRALKELAGTFRSDRHNMNEPILNGLVTAPRCPGHLKGEAQKTWRVMARLLTTMGVLTQVDLTALEVLCVVYGRWRNAEDYLAEHGLHTYGGVGGVSLIASPYVKISADCSVQLRAWLLEFGLTPSSRSRVSVASVQVKEGPRDREKRDWFGDSHRN